MAEVIEKEDAIQLRLITNPFDTTFAIREELVYNPEFTLLEYMEGLPSPESWVIGYNGLALQSKLWNTVQPKPGDVVSLVRVPEGGGDGKEILRLVALIALAVFAPQLAALASLGATATGFLTAAIIVAGALVINALLPPPLPDLFDGEATSPSYGIDGPKNTNAQGTVVPVGYGQHRIGGNFVDLYTENLNDTQYLFGRLVLNDGEIEEVTDIEINDQPIANFQNVETRVRFGLETETVNDWFPQSIKLVNRGVKLDTNYVTHTTESEVDKIRLDIVAPNGVVSFNDKGKPTGYSVGLEIEYRLFGTTTFTRLPVRQLVSFTGSSPTNTNYVGATVRGTGTPIPGRDMAYRTNDNVEYRAVGATTWLPFGSSSREYSAAGTMSFTPDTNTSDTLDPTFETFYEQTLPPGQYEFRSTGNGLISNLVAGVVTGATSDGAYRVDGNSTKAIRRTLESIQLPRGRYEVRVRRLQAQSTDPQISDAVYLTDVGEIDMSPIRMNGTATLSVRVKISDQLNNVPKITSLVKFSKLKEYDDQGNFVIERWSANPAWIVLDMLTNPLRGAGLALSRFDWPKWVEWAEFCTQEGLEFNGIFDFETSVWEGSQAVMRCGHAQFVRVGTKWSVAIDRAAEPVMLFTDSNILDGTMSTSWLPMLDRANEIQLSYFEKTDGYRQSTVRLVDNDIAVNGESTRSTTYQQRGITNRQQAMNEAEYQMRRNKLLRKSLSFDAPIEAIGLGIGDVALVQYQAGDYAGGAGGRMVSGSTTTVARLDRPVTIEAGNSYRLLVHHAAVQRYTVNIVSISGGSAFVTGLPTGTINRCTRLRKGGIDVGIIDIIDGTPQDIIKLDSVAGLTTGTAELWDTNVVEERTITTAAGTHEQLTVSSAFSIAPTEFANWMFGKVATVKQPFRLIGIGGDDPTYRSLSFIEYDDRLYLPPGVPIPEVDVTPVDQPQQVRDISVEYQRFPSGDQNTSVVVVSWNVENRLRYGGADVYLRSADAGWVFIKSVTDVTAAEVALSDADSGLFKVVGYDKQGRRANFTEAPIYLFSANFTYRLLAPPTNLTVDDRRYDILNRLDVSWTAPVDEVVSLYRVDTRRLSQAEYDAIIATPSLIKPGPLATPAEVAAWDALFKPAFVTSDTAGTIDFLAEGYYSFRVRAERGQSYSDWTVITHVLDVPGFISAVTGLRLDKGGTNFTGKDAVFVWDDIFVNAAATLTGDQDGIPFVLRNYEVQIRDTGGTLVRTDYTEVPTYTYTFEKNVADSSAIVDTARRAFQISVRAIGRQGQISAAATLSVSNPPPALPAVEIVPLYGQVILKFSEPLDPDFAGFVVYKTAVNGVPVTSPPVFTSGTAVSFAENATGTVYTAAATGSGPITYSLSGTDAARFSLNSTTGVLTFLTPPNFESPTDVGADNIYNVTITATNSFGSTVRNLTVTVTDVVEGSNPVFTSGTTATFAENATGTVYTAAASGSTPMTYSITGGADAADFAINSSTGALTFVTPPNFEAPADADTNNTYVVQITATNSFGSANQTVTVTVTDVTEGTAPTFTSAATANFAENGTGTAYTAVATGSGPISYSISGTDAADFNINSSTGAVTFAVTPNFEAPADSDANNVYNITVTATNSFGSSNLNVAITVTDVAEGVAPTFTSATTANFAENGTGTAYTAVATGSGPITYSISGGLDAALFSINGSTGVVTFNTSPNFEAPADSGANNVYNITVTATNSFGSVNQGVTITVTDVADNAPTFTSATTASFAENATGAVYTAVATGSGTITYSISGGADAAKFNINSSTGAVTFISSPDFETPTDVGANNVYDIIITATNAFGSATRNVAITVTDVAEGGPTFDPAVIHAWDPDGGANASGQIADAVGAATLWAIQTPASPTPISNWNGEVLNQQALTTDASQITDFRNAPFATLSFWVLRRSTADAYPTIAGWIDANPFSGGTAGGFLCTREGPTHDLAINVRGTSANYNAKSGEDGMGNDTWTFVTMVLGANQWFVYRNGVPEVDMDWNSQAKSTTMNTRLAFGGGYTGVNYNDAFSMTNDFNGRFGDIRVWNKALTPAEITALYAAGRQSF